VIEWAPISRAALLDRIARGESQLSPRQRRLWHAVRIEPQKWQQLPYGTPGLGFWVVGLVGQTVIWYNDIEEGFNRSRYSTFGTIDDYWANQDELAVALEYVLTALDTGCDLLRLIDQS
jgi:hypothetical protein